MKTTPTDIDRIPRGSAEVPAMQRAAQQLPPGWEIGALFPGTETREVLHRDWPGTPDHPALQ